MHVIIQQETQSPFRILVFSFKGRRIKKAKKQGKKKFITLVYFVQYMAYSSCIMIIILSENEQMGCWWDVFIWATITLHKHCCKPVGYSSWTGNTSSIFQKLPRLRHDNLTWQSNLAAILYFEMFTHMAKDLHNKPLVCWMGLLFW